MLKPVEAGDRRAQLEHIIADGDFQVLFQPIVDLADGSLVAVEALTRGPAGTALHTPDALFAAAAEFGLLHELDTLCAARALRAATRHPGELPPLVFVNSDPRAFTGPPPPELQAATAEAGPYRIVLEFTERALGTNPTGLLDITRMLHEDGNGIAFDDVGADPLSLAFLPLLEPEVVKLDLHLLRDPFSRHTITTVTGVGAYAERTGATVIAEGVETEQDRDRARSFGARWGQGWLFGRPGPLDALAGRPIDRHAGLRASRPDLTRRGTGPFLTAADRHPAHRGDLPIVRAYAEHLLGILAAAGNRGVVLALDDDQAALGTWLPGLPQAAARAGYSATLTPGDGEAALIIITPDTTTALCLRRSPELEFVLTHDPATVLPIARMLLARLGTRVRRGSPPVGARVPAAGFTS